MDARTQKARILEYAAEHGSITVREVFEKLHINSPTARLCELRKAGMIESECTETYIDAEGTEKSYKRYFMKKVN